MKQLLLFIFLIIAGGIWSQDLVIPITGKISDQDKGGKVGGVTVTLLHNGTTVSTTQTSSNGKYVIQGKGPKTGVYEVVYSKPGMVSKRIKLDFSDVNVEDLPPGNEVPVPALDVDLFAERENIDFSFLDKEPVASFYWRKKDFVLDFDRSASAQVKNKIDKLLNEAEKKAAELEANYNKAVLAGDMFFEQKEYQKAVDKYEEALTYKPKEPYPAQKLLELDALMQAAKEDELAKAQADAKYNGLIKEADKLRDEDKLESAINKYKEALKEKDEQYPKDQIAAAQALIEKRKKEAENQEKYDKAIAEAEVLLKNEELQKSRAKFVEASGLKSTEQYPKDKIAEIDALLEKEKNAAQREKNYQAAITAADQLFNNKSYEKAKEKYIEASGIKPEEQYPKDKIALCDQKIEEAKSSAEQQKQIAEFISKGDKAMQKTAYQEAIDNFNEALKIDPTHKEASDKLKIAQQKLEDQKGKEETEARFNELVSEGDSRMLKEDYAAAVDSYREALTIKSAPAVEVKLKDAIAKQNAMEGEAKKREEYEKLVSQGAQAMAASKWIEAKSNYQQALQLFPDEKEPKDKLAEIEKELKNAESQAEIDKQYKEHIQAGDKLLNQKKYLDAIKSYNAALALKPGEREPVDKAAEAQKLLEADKDDSDRLYEKILTTAEQKAEERDYDRAIELIERAKDNRPEDKRPDEILARINELKKQDQKYDQFLSEGNKLAAAKKYEAAREKYVAARDTKPKETVPSEKIAEMDKLIAESANAAEREALYKKYMTEGNDLANKSKYEDALSAFQNALNVKSDDKPAQNKINEMQQILDDLANKSAAEKKQRELFDSFITQADNAFDDESFLDAKNLYEKALEIFPNDKYALKRRDESIAMEQKKTLREEEEQYRSIIEKADNYFDQKDYENAREYYQRALNVRNRDVYPKNRLAEIETLLNPVVVQSGDLEDLGIPFSGSILDGETLLQKAEAERKSAKTEGVLKTTEEITVKEAEMTKAKKQEHLNTTNEIYEIQKNVISRTVDDDNKRRENVSTLDRAAKELEEKDKSDVYMEHQEALGNKKVITQIEQDAELDYNENQGVYQDNFDVLDRYKVAQEIAVAEKVRAENNKYINADQELTTIDKNIKSEMIDDYTSRELAGRKVVEVDKSMQGEMLKEHEKNYRSAVEAKVTVEGIEKRAEEATVDGKKLANDNSEQLKKVAEELVKNEEGKVEEEQKLSYVADESINKIEKNVENRFNEGVKVSKDNNEEVKAIDNNLVEKDYYMSNQKEESLRKKDLQVQAKTEKAASDQEGLAQNREKNAVVIDKGSIDLAEEQRQQYNKESVKYLTNVDRIQKEVDVNNEINGVAEDALAKKIEYTETMENKTRSDNEQLIRDDKSGRLDAVKTINKIEVDYSDNETEEIKRTQKNAPVINEIEQGLAEGNKEKGKGETNAHYDAVDKIDQISDKPPKKTVMVNSLGKEYPEGVSEESFTRQDQNGLTTQLITRRIVVVDGHADVYIRTQTSHGITYSKNGNPSLEHVWQSETQNPKLERHF